MSNLSELLPAGAGAKSAEFVASGTLGSGQTVVLKTDGTVEAISATAIPPSLGTKQTYTTNNAYTNDIADVGNDKIIIFYADASNSFYPTAVVGTISGTTITFASPVVVESAGNQDRVSVVYSSTDSVAIFAWTVSTAGRIRKASLSGTTLTFGTAQNFTGSQRGFEPTLVMAETENYAILIYRREASSYYAFYRNQECGNGTTVSQAGETSLWSANVSSLSLAASSSLGEVVFGMKDSGTGYLMSAALPAAYTTGFSLSSRTSIGSVGSIEISGYNDSLDRGVVYWSTGLYKYTRVFSTAGASGVTLQGSNTLVDYGSSNDTNIATSIATDGSSIAFSYRDSANNNYGTVRLGTMTSTSVTITNPYPAAATLVTDYTVPISNKANDIKYITSQGVYVYGGKDQDVSDGVSHIITEASSNSADFIGITDQAIADTATGAVIVQGGVSEKVSGLTVGADYYVQDDGSLASGSIPFDISGASFVQNFSVAAQDNSLQGIAFNNDGTKMFVVGQTGDAVYEYILLTGYDVSSASYSQSFSVTAQDTNPREIAFNNDGTKMFVLGYAGQDVNEYTLSTGFDLGSTVTFVDAFSVSSQENQPYGLAFNADGTKMFIVGQVGDDVNEYTLSTGFDVSTASFVDSFSVVLQDTQPRGIAFNASGTKMFIVGRTDVVVDAYTLSTGFDVSSASFVDSFSVATQENNPTSIAFSADGDKMFIVGITGDDVNEYSTTPASTTVPAGRALSTTSILLEG